MNRHTAERLDDLNLSIKTCVIGHVVNILRSSRGKHITYEEIANKAQISDQVARDAVEVISEAYKNLIAEES